MIKAIIASIIGMTCWVLSLSALAQTYPDHPIKILQGFAPGGNADNIARSIGLEVSKSLGQGVVVEAQTGAGGTIASASVARAKPDGYTLLLATGGHAVAGALYNSLPYKTVADFEMVSTITYFPFLVVTSAESKFKTFSDLLDAARVSANGLTYGSAGIGSTHHLAGELLAKMGRMKLVHSPYRGDAASITALLANDVDFIIAPPTAVITNIKSGKLRALAITSSKRMPEFPNVPTFAEQGYPKLIALTWFSLSGPPGMPPALVEKLNKEARKIMQSQVAKDTLAKQSMETFDWDSARFTQYVGEELKQWAPMIKTVKPEN